MRRIEFGLVRRRTEDSEKPGQWLSRLRGRGGGLRNRTRYKILRPRKCIVSNAGEKRGRESLGRGLRKRTETSGRAPTDTISHADPGPRMKVPDIRHDEGTGRGDRRPKGRHNQPRPSSPSDRVRQRHVDDMLCDEPYL